MQENTKQHYLKHINSVIQSQRASSPDDYASAHGLIARSKDIILKICGSNSPYAQQADEVLDIDASVNYRSELLVGILKALRKDIQDGFLQSSVELIRAEMFDKFTNMAEYLAKEGYKDAAAVIAGSSLEVHLRQLCIKSGIEIDLTTSQGVRKAKKAELLNQDLGKNVYSLLDQKQITTWLELRNNAAHGIYTAYSSDQVLKMIEWIKDFIIRTPA